MSLHTDSLKSKAH